MYNSFIVSTSVKIWNWILFGYEGSLLKGLIELIKFGLGYLFNGSVVKRFFISRRSIIEESFVYLLVRNITDLINQVLIKINKFIKRASANSIIYINTYKLFSTEVDALRSLFIFTFFFGMGLVGNNIIRGFYSGRSYIIAIIITIGSLLGLSLKENYKEILNGSWFYRFCNSIFSIDEGGDNWW